MTFSLIDAVIVVLYLAGIALFGILMGGRQRSARDYFVSDRAVPWWAICLTIVATETSALTFLSLPGMAYAGSMIFLQLAIGYIVGRIAVAVFLIPRYFEGDVPTAYAVLEQKFSPALRRGASGVFMLTRLFADGVRLYTTAIPLALILETFDIFPSADRTAVYVLSMGCLTALTLLYVFYGGIRAVIWTDVVQWFIYLFGAVLSLVILFQLLPGSPVEVLGRLAGQGKLTMIRLLPEGGWSAFLSEPYTLLSGIVGGMFLSMASHGTDQLIVQRVLAAGAPAPARRAMIASGVVIFVQFFVFLLVGALLSLHFGDSTRNPNEVFASFILHELPVGVTGLIIAGILAAAMSTLSSSISALGSATVMDVLVPLRRSPLDESQTLRLSRRVSMVWAVVLLGIATLFIGTPAIVVELALSIASYTYGGLLGLFFLRLLPIRLSVSAAAAGFFLGIVANGLVVLFTPLAWTWYTLTGTLLTIGIAVLAGRFFSAKRTDSGGQS